MNKHCKLTIRLFGALIIEPADSVFLNPKNGKPLKSGANAVIKKANGESMLLMRIGK